MIRVFRIVSGIGVGIWVFALVVFMVPGADEMVLGSSLWAALVNGLGAVGALCLGVQWPAAVWHWRRQYPPHPDWVMWGFVLILLPVVGALAYWLVASRSYPMPEPIGKEQAQSVVD